jgi:hypothetical protein
MSHKLALALELEEGRDVLVVVRGDVLVVVRGGVLVVVGDDGGVRVVVDDGGGVLVVVDDGAQVDRMVEVVGQQVAVGSVDGLPLCDCYVS